MTGEGVEAKPAAVEGAVMGGVAWAVGEGGGGVGGGELEVGG